MTEARPPVSIRTYQPSSEPVTVLVDGRPVPAIEGESVAAALLAAGIRILGAPEQQSPERGLVCAMGVCYQCLVAIDGRPGFRACMTPVAGGMVIDTGRTL